MMRGGAAGGRGGMRGMTRGGMRGRGRGGVLRGALSLRGVFLLDTVCHPTIDQARLMPYSLLINPCGFMALHLAMFLCVAQGSGCPWAVPCEAVDLLVG